MAERKVVAGIVRLRDSRVLVGKVPETQIAIGRAQELVDLGEKFELSRAKQVVFVFIRIELIPF